MSFDLEPEGIIMAGMIGAGDRERPVAVKCKGRVYAVMQQPDGDDCYVGSENDAVTEFRLAHEFSGGCTTGFLAHNGLEPGRSIQKLEVGDWIVLTRGLGVSETYQVTQKNRYQALRPTDVHSSFIDLKDSNQVELPAWKVFETNYLSGTSEVPTLVFQTCIAENDEEMWGRLLVIACLVS